MALAIYNGEVVGTGFNPSTIASEFDINKYYTINDLVFYMMQLYVFIEDKEPGLWNSSKVKSTTIDELYSEDKTKLDSIEYNANNYVLPSATTKDLGGVKVDVKTITISNGVISAVGGSSGTNNYTDLINKPSINGVELNGNKTLADLGISIPENTSDLNNDSNFVVDANYNHTDNNYANADKEKLIGIEDNANKYVLPKASETHLGGVKVDGTTITVAEDGTISSVESSTEIDNITYEEYQALTEEERANYVGTVTGYPMQGGGSGGSVSYTYEEQDTGIKWVDGKSIYQITIDNDFALTTGWTDVPGFDCTGKIPLSVETYLNGIDEYVIAGAVKVSGTSLQAVFIVGSNTHSSNITTIKYLKEA